MRFDHDDVDAVTRAAVVDWILGKYRGDFHATYHHNRCDDVQLVDFVGHDDIDPHDAAFVEIQAVISCPHETVEWEGSRYGKLAELVDAVTTLERKIA